MKTSALMISLATLILCVSVGSAQTSPDEHEGHHPAATPTPAPNVRPESSDNVNAAPAASRMRENMKAMQDLMTKIRSTKNPAERERLMQEHMKAMHDQMEMMMEQMLLHQEMQDDSKERK